MILEDSRGYKQRKMRQRLVWGGLLSTIVIYLLISIHLYTSRYKHDCGARSQPIQKLEEEINRLLRIINENVPEDKYQQKSAERACQPRTSIVFQKTHKCASSTLQNILLRFGDKRNLTFALPNENAFYYRHVFDYTRRFQREFVMHIPGIQEYDIFCHHAVFNKKEMEAVMTENTAFISIVRSPVKNFESTFDYYGSSRKHGVDHYENPLMEFIRRAEKDPLNLNYTYGPNKCPMMHDFGLTRTRDKSNEIKVKERIKSLDQDIDLVLISDYFDESMILLKELMCWDYDDIVYLPKVVRNKQRVRELTLDEEQRIRSWNKGDVILFDHFNRTFWTRVEAFGKERMQKELEIFRKRKQIWEEKCTNKRVSGRLFRDFQFKTDAFGRVDMECRRLGWWEQPYTEYIRHKQLFWATRPH
ncbi:galactosylceramide sulfotransferase-like isoform X2 [Anneissia japonica]|nr:galactosylceramide sulfotransferase-like isoform X2 [Anneissia japonica]